LTPPSTKPDPGATDEAASDSTGDATPAAETATEEESQNSGKVTRLSTMRRRRAAALELRLSRTAAREGSKEAGGGGTKSGPKAGGPRAGTGPRGGLRAQALAARAAMAEANADGAVKDQPPKGTAGVRQRALATRRKQQAAAAKDPVAVPTAELDSPALSSTTENSATAQTAASTGIVAAAVGDVVARETGDGDGVSKPDTGAKRRPSTRAARRALNGPKTQETIDYVVAPTVNMARMRPRHFGVIAFFCLFVVVPLVSYSWYLWTRAADQYESSVGFGTRTEETSSNFDLLGALGGGSQSSSKDMDILNQFIISQELVAKIDADLDLKSMWSKAGDDPLNAFHSAGTIEDLVAFWQRMVLVDYDNGTGLMNLRVYAFDPVDAQKIATAVLNESTNIINVLSKTAQDDTTRYSKDALAATEKKLTEARLAVLDFQVRNKIVDPSNVVANQLSVVSTLNQQLATAQIELDMLTGTVPAADPRLAQLTKRLEVIRNRIAEEQSKVGATADSDSPGFAKLMADFENLKVELDFAQRAYLSALAAYDQALTDAQHKTRYLVAYVAPTLAEAPTAPNRPLSAALAALIGFLLWSVSVLTYYALRDRR
jgi:capsular polysaccharide transport system permease protein